MSANALIRSSIKARLTKDTLVVSGVAIGVFASLRFGLFKRWFDLDIVAQWVRFDEWALGAFVLALSFAVLASRRWRALEQLADRMSALYRTGQIVSSVLDPDEVTRQIVGATRDIMGYSHVTVMMIKDDALVPTSWAGYASRPPEVGIEQGTPGRVVRTGRPVLASDVSRDADFVPGPTAIASQIACPIYVDGQTIGVFSVETVDSRRLGSDDLELIDSLAVQLGLALRNAMRYKQTLEQAIQDGLTGLYNHAYFHERIREEMARARRYGRPLALIMADMDDFKALNDTYGHIEGDRVLRAFAEIIRKAVREVDFPARYGGEEFAIVMPETTRREAQAVAERIRSELDRSSLLRIHGTDLHVTASFGVAAFPEDAGDAVDLMRRTDELLYEAKKGGKNRVCAESPRDASPEEKGAGTRPQPRVG